MKKNLKIGRNGENIKWEYDVIYHYFYEYSEDVEEAIKNLKKKVNFKCNKGWIPEGAMNCVLVDNDCKYLFQTMIRPIIDSNAKESKTTLACESEIIPGYHVEGGEL